MNGLTKKYSYKTIFAITFIISAICISILIIIMINTNLTNVSNNFLQSGQHLRVAVLTDALFSDRGWGASSLNAANFIRKKHGLEVTVQDNVTIPDIESTLKKYANAGYNLIIAHGVQWGEPALRIGKQYPNVNFVVFTGLVKSNNVASIFPMQQEGSFLLGALAGLMTKTDVIGFVGGEDYPNVVNIFEGYKRGAITVNPGVRVIETYLNDWDNPEKGKEHAITLIRQKADLLFHVADSSGHGVIQAAKENGIYAFGAVQDQNLLAPDVVLSSFVLDVDKAYDQVISMVLNGTFHGEILKPGIEAGKGSPGNGIVYLAPFHNLEDRVPESVRIKLKELYMDILKGRIVVPEIYYIVNHDLWHQPRT